MKYSKKPRICKNGHESNIYAWDNDKCHCGEPNERSKTGKEKSYWDQNTY